MTRHLGLQFLPSRLTGRRNVERLDCALLPRVPIIWAGLVYREAMPCGKPVIGGSDGGAPGVIADDTTGFLVQHGTATWGNWVRSRTLLAGPALAREIRARGRPRGEGIPVRYVCRVF
jgi:hypothetical protein